MEAREFQEMPLFERVQYINKLLIKEGDEPLKNIAKSVGLSYTTFCKEMRRGGFTYSQSKRQYEKTLSIEEYKEIQDSIPDNENSEEVFRFFSNHLNEIKEMLGFYQSQLILDPKVYDPESKSISKSLVVNQEIYNQFVDLCAKKFPHLRLKDIVSHLLYGFTKRYEETPSNS